MNTTENQNDPYAELKAAYKAGKTIQITEQEHQLLWEELTVEPAWNMPVEMYRIKPKTSLADKWVIKDECICGGGPHWAKRCPVHASTLAIAPDPSPAGKLSDKELGEIGRKRAYGVQTRITGNPLTSMCPYNTSDEPARTAFAAAVREQVEKEQAEDATWKAAALLWESRFIEKRNEFAKQAEEITRLTAKFEACDQARKNACDDRDAARNELATLQRSYEGERNCSAERMTQILNLQREVAQLTAKTAEMVMLNAKHRTELAVVTAERDRLQWRPVSSVKPTREDADVSGGITVLKRDGIITQMLWHSEALISFAAWRPACPPPAPTAEEVERERFEEVAKSKNWVLDRLSPLGDYAIHTVQCTWEGWQARAAKEGEK